MDIDASSILDPKDASAQEINAKLIAVIKSLDNTLREQVQLLIKSNTSVAGKLRTGSTSGSEKKELQPHFLTFKKDGMVRKRYLLLLFKKIFTNICMSIQGCSFLLPTCVHKEAASSFRKLYL